MMVAAEHQRDVNSRAWYMRWIHRVIGRCPACREWKKIGKEIDDPYGLYHEESCTCSKCKQGTELFAKSRERSQSVKTKE